MIESAFGVAALTLSGVLVTQLVEILRRHLDEKAKERARTDARRAQIEDYRAKIYSDFLGATARMIQAAQTLNAAKDQHDRNPSSIARERMEDARVKYVTELHAAETEAGRAYVVSNKVVHDSITAVCDEATSDSLITPPDPKRRAVFRQARADFLEAIEKEREGD